MSGLKITNFMEAQKLIIGNRYFLDAAKDVSGVYLGDCAFDKITGNVGAYIIIEGVIRFTSESGFYELES
jgi:hypothetical protein